MVSRENLEVACQEQIGGLHVGIAVSIEPGRDILFWLASESKIMNEEFGSLKD